MSRFEYRKHWDPKVGYTMEEARRKKEQADSDYCVRSATSPWKPAKIVIDRTKTIGYMVVIETKK